MAICLLCLELDLDRPLGGVDAGPHRLALLAADLPDEAMPGLVLEYEYHTGDASLDRTTQEVRQLRRQADEIASAAAARTSEVAADLVIVATPLLA